eukprot:GABV01008549.1.p1 GENE.GABV01008549.1~~GABV01008549.1.p1  ORF type:complete len:178 (-),score=55.54 GABV01008549.1:584-1117(-)
MGSTRKFGLPVPPTVNHRICAPEIAEAIIENRLESLPSTPASDVFSLGLLAFYLMTGRDYFSRDKYDSDQQVLEALASPGWRVSDSLLAGIDVGPCFRGLLYRMLERDPSKRIRLGDIVNHRALRSQQFAGGPPPASPPSQPSNSKPPSPSTTPTASPRPRRRKHPNRRPTNQRRRK